MSYLRVNEKEKEKAKVRARKAKVKARRARKAKAKGRKAKVKVKVKEKVKADVLTVVSQGIRREIAGQMSQIGSRMTMEFTTVMRVSSDNLSNVPNLAHLITQLQRTKTDNPSGENHLPAFTIDLSASSLQVVDAREVRNVDTGIQGSATCGKRITANWGTSASSCTKKGSKEMGVVINRHHRKPPDLRVEEGDNPTRTWVT